MTKSPRYQQAREAMAKWLAGITTTDEDASAALWAFEDQEYYRQKADALLSLKDPNGKPYLAVVSADQTFPPLSKQASGESIFTYVEHTRLLVNVGFVKVEKP